ncbi:MAG: CotH kinase family protein [candidate division KSB1 bacterium]|nr:CotH kinase family protein [candidate division KSB1 bacterium]MDZ7340968.1 CotH kinase family protein [candidate division KSB1 bacterium]
MMRVSVFGALGLLLVLQSAVLPQVPPSIRINGNMSFSSSNLPIVIINTFGQTIRDLYRIQASMQIIDNGVGLRNYLTNPPNNYDGWIDIELRGSASLTYPKKQYRFETQDDQRNNLNVSLMGLPEENDWILYGPYDDQSLIRNVLAYTLSNDIGRYACRTRFCELVLNNDYRGVYVLMEKIKRDKNRVNISKLDSLDKTGDAVTGGYIFKFDKDKGENVGGWWSNRGIFYQYHDPAADEIIQEQKNYLRDFMNQFEAAMLRPDIADSNTGYPKFIDVASFVDHFILCEYCKNIDAYRISNFMHKDRDSKGGKLTEGPIWDFNLAFGKTWFAEDAFRVDEWEIDHNRYKPNDWPKVPYWWERLGHDREFARQVRERWLELIQGPLQPDRVFRLIDTFVDTLEEARARNFARWPETASKHSYEAEIEQMKNWLTARIAWIESHLDQLSPVEIMPGINTTPVALHLAQNYPNPFNASTTIRYHLPQAGWVQLWIYNLSGQVVRWLVDDFHLPGGYEVTWDGRDTSGQPAASGVYCYELETDCGKTVKKLLLLR